MIFVNLSAPALSIEPAMPFQSLIFNGGEPHIKLQCGDVSPDTPVMITVQARSSDDVMKVLLAKDALDQAGFKHVSLFIPYFPGARQDRVMDEGEALSVKVYARLINAAQFEQVIVFDPHSDVTPALLDRCRAIRNHELVREVLTQIPQPVTLVSPDAGAAKKMQKLAKALSWDRVLQCGKTRNEKDGSLSAPKVYEDDLQGADCMIVDDICDRGGTFLQLARALREKNAGKLYLCVSHGIFKSGFDELLSCFDLIFTTNSFYAGEAPERVVVLPIHH